MIPEVRACSTLSGATAASGISKERRGPAFYAATCYTWLGEAERAEEHAREVIAQSVSADGVVRWPTRLAVARLDLALVAVQRGQPDEAAQLGIWALHSGRVGDSTLGWFAELDRILYSNHADVPEVNDFHQQYLLAGPIAR
jgi:hypothetical protein